MGSCMSSESSEYSEQRKKSQAIDRKLDEDSRKLRRECKILLLGTFAVSSMLVSPIYLTAVFLLGTTRVWGKRQINNRQTNENHPSKWLYSGGTGFVSLNGIQESVGLRQVPHRSLPPVLPRAVKSKGPRLYPISFRLQHRPRSKHAVGPEGWRCDNVYMERPVYLDCFGTSK